MPRTRTTEGGTPQRAGGRGAAPRQAPLRLTGALLASAQEAAADRKTDWSARRDDRRDRGWIPPTGVYTCALIRTAEGEANGIPWANASFVVKEDPYDGDCEGRQFAAFFRFTEKAMPFAIQALIELSASIREGTPVMDPNKQLTWLRKAADGEPLLSVAVGPHRPSEKTGKMYADFNFYPIESSDEEVEEDAEDEVAEDDEGDEDVRVEKKKSKTKASTTSGKNDDDDEDEDEDEYEDDEDGDDDDD